MAKAKHFIATDGRIQLRLTPCAEGGYLVTSPLDPELITQAESLEEAFANAHDAAAELILARRQLRAGKPRVAQRSA